MQLHPTPYYNKEAFVAAVGRPPLVKGKSRKGQEEYKVFNVPAAFDIETSSFYSGGEKSACMYVWQMGIDGHVIIGRTWEQFIDTLDTLIKALDISPKQKLVIYVHNLAYEFQFIRKYFNWVKVFGLRERDVMEAETADGIVFKCSYHLSGKSLAETAKDCTLFDVSKMVDDLDYDKPRHSGTPLTDKEIGYCVGDVLVVMAYIYEQIKQYHLISYIPLTNTGRVRGYCKKHCLYDGKYRNQKYSLAISGMTIGSIDEYDYLKNAFQGGFTHASHTKVWGTYENVTSKDFTSSYPAVMLSETFPMSSGVEVKVKNRKEFDHYIKNFHCIFDMKFHDIKERVTFEHILSISKCFDIRKATCDNGRVVKAESVTTYLTEIDYESMKQFYTWSSCEIGRMWIYQKGYLPKEFIECILHFYEGKTKLKGVSGREAEYQWLKGMLNALFGMAVTDIIREEPVYSNDAWATIPKTQQDIEEELAHYNNSFNRFLFYPWGVFITAYARRNLYTGILECKDDYIYSDTDSVKILHGEKHEAYFKKYNTLISEKISRVMNFYGLDIARTSPKDVNGVEHPIGVWDDDGFYIRFKTLGAKRYMIENEKGLKITVAGLSKKKGTEYIEQQQNPFLFFDNDMYIPAEFSGRLTHTYIDEETQGVLVDYLGVSGAYRELSSVHLEKSEYHMTMADEFIRYLTNAQMVEVKI